MHNASNRSVSKMHVSANGSGSSMYISVNLLAPPLALLAMSPSRKEGERRQGGTGGAGWARGRRRHDLGC